MPRGANLTPERARHLRSLTKRKTLAERFWEKVDRRGPDECWNWLANIQIGGYGHFYVGSVNGRPRLKTAHRVAWGLLVGEVPPGLVLDHICKNPACCNPAHLRPVTQLDNCTVLARPTPFFTNMQKTHCAVCNNPLSGENLAVVPTKRKGKPATQRACLTCYPHQWRHAVVPRPRPPGSHWKPADPDYHLRPSANNVSSTLHGPTEEKR